MSPLPTVSAPLGSPGRTYSKAKALASKLGVHPKTLFRWSQAGRIHRYKVTGRVVLFDESEVAELIENARVN